MQKQDPVVRGLLLGSLFVAFLASLANGKKEWPQPLPLFMDPEFKFSQIDTVCLAPVLDLRSDKTAQLSFTERGPSTGFFPNQRIHTANQTLTESFKQNGYRTTECDPVNATLNDLRSPSDTWRKALNFGSSNWLFIVGVEDISSSATWLSGEGGHAIVSGFLFEKQSNSARLVWRDRSFGVAEAGYLGRKGTVERGESYIAANHAIMHLLSRFERRSRGRLIAFDVDYENFGTSCDQVWTALKSELTGDSKKYRAAFLDESDRMALYTMYHLSGGGNEDHVVLRTHETGCVMELSQGSEIGRARTHDWNELTKKMRASLAK